MSYVYVRTAVRTFNRIWQPICDEFNEFAACDRQFDHGEFSDAAIDYAFDSLRMEYARRIGVRFGLLGEDLLDMVDAASNYEWDCFMQSMQDEAA